MTGQLSMISLMTIILITEKQEQTKTQQNESRKWNRMLIYFGKRLIYSSFGKYISWNYWLGNVHWDTKIVCYVAFGCFLTSRQTVMMVWDPFVEKTQTPKVTIFTAICQCRISLKQNTDRDWHWVHAQTYHSNQLVFSNQQQRYVCMCIYISCISWRCVVSWS